jgi:hypothetical protein
MKSVSASQKTLVNRNDKDDDDDVARGFDEGTGTTNW